jgi:hypothetical protein
MRHRRIHGARSLRFVAITRIRTGILAFGVLVTAPFWLVESELSAQGCTQLPCPPNEAPRIFIIPGSNTYSTRDVEVSIYASDDRGLNRETWSGPFQLTYDASGASAWGNGTVHLQDGANVLTAYICDFNISCTPESVTYTYTPPPPPPPRAYPMLSLTPHGGDVRIVSGCAGCMAGTHAYTPPAYYTLDVARSVTLEYSSATAYAVGLVQIDATVITSEPPTRLTLQLRRPDEMNFPRFCRHLGQLACSSSSSN